MASYLGEHIHVSVFGQSHSPAIGVVVDGLPAGERVDMEELGRFLKRRAPGQNATSTPRKEADLPKFLSGIALKYREIVVLEKPVYAAISAKVTFFSPFFTLPVSLFIIAHNGF